LERNRQFGEKKATLKASVWPACRQRFSVVCGRRGGLRWLLLKCQERIAALIETRRPAEKQVGEASWLLGQRWKDAKSPPGIWRDQIPATAAVKGRRTLSESTCAPAMDG